MNNRIIPITDARGQHLLPTDEQHEPLPGSVALTQGLHGTAWQRFFSDGKWHSVGEVEPPQDWESLLSRRNLVLIYDAERRQVPSAARIVGAAKMG